MAVAGVSPVILVVAPTAAHALPAFATTTSASLNWGGYVATGASGSVTSVNGSWIQPSVKCSATTAYAAFWVGIDGYSSSDLYQTGTQAVCSGGVASYGAWWEILPAAETPISMSITPGNIISATVNYSTSDGKFTMTITDVNTSATYAHTSSVATSATRNSADWITETPEVGGTFAHLANFGTVHWGKDKTHVGKTNDATISGVTGDLTHWSSTLVEISIVNTADTKYMAEPGAVSKDGTSFLVKWKSSGP
jgi:hypothetical protein